MSEIPKRYGDHARGVTLADISMAADEMLRKGDRPTVEKLRAKVGGSPNTIGPLLDRWWSSLSSRLDAGPAALHRLPESVAKVAEALWVQALEEGRRRAAIEQNKLERANTQAEDHLILRSHILSLREGELESRLHDRERVVSDLSQRVRALELQVKKRDAENGLLTQRITEISKLLAQRRQPVARPPAKRESTSGRPAKKRAREPRKPIVRRKARKLRKR